MILNLFLTQETLYPKEIKQDLTLRAKNNNTLDLWFFDEDDVVVNIAGSEIYFMVKDNPSQSDDDAKINKKITDLTDPTNGNAQIELSSSDTASLLNSYVYQIKIKYSSKWYTVSEGNITFKQNIITRET